MNDPDTPASRWRWSLWLPSLGIAIVAAGGLLISISYDEGRYGPGITLDESFNVQQGVRLVRVIPHWISGRLTLAQSFGESEDLKSNDAIAGYHLPDHPPLGRLWLGLSHETAVVVLGKADDAPDFSTRHARTGSAIAFGLTILIVGWCTARWYGPVAGAAAAFALATMPRVVGHAQLASLETFTNLTLVAAVLSVAGMWKDRPPTSRVAAFTGFLFGLALLSKIQAVVIPIPLAGWALWRYRMAAIRPLAIWGVTAGVVFFIGWPWLWIDPVGHVTAYFGQATERVVLKTWYFGETYLDRETPWHYPYVMFLVTLPIGWLMLGFAGLFQREPDKNRLLLPIAVLLFTLTLFAIPGVVVYDGVRLFLIAFPLWAVFAGKGAAIVFDACKERFSKPAAVAGLSIVMLCQTVGVIWHHPVQTSYYNATVGGLWGAEKLGLEPTYWGDSLTPQLLEKVAASCPPGSEVHVSPVLHPLYLSELQSQSPALRRAGIKLKPYDPELYGQPRYVLFFRRRADLFPELESGPNGARLIAEVRRQVVLLAGIYEFPP